MSDQFARMGKHTPGPWIAVGDEIYGADGSRVAEAVRDIELVRAAPELLAERDALVQATGASSVLEAIGIIRGNKAELDRLTTLDWREEVCECHACLHKKGVRVITKMILCPTCGNKRCPHASDHRLDCTDSNEPGQAGSVYAVPTEPEPEPVAWRTFDGEGGYDYRTASLEENYRNEYIARNGKAYADWVQPLYTAPLQLKPLTDEEIDKAIAQERDALLDHIYEYGTTAEGVLERIRRLARAAIAKAGGNDE